MANLYLLLTIEILLFLISFIFNEQDIFAPSTMMTLVFIFSTFLAMLNSDKWNIEYNFYASLLLSTGLAVFVITDVCMVDYYRKRESRILLHNQINYIRIDAWKIYLSILLDLIIVILVYKEVVRIAGTGSAYSNLFFAYRQIANSSMKETEQYMNSIVVQLMKFVICSGFICGVVFVNNVFVCKGKVIRNYIYIIPGIIMSIMTLITGNRTNILRLFICLLVSYYILMQYKNYWSMKVSWKFVKILAFSLLIVFVLFSISQEYLGRSGSTGLFDVISNYAGASIQLFNLYITEPCEANIVWGQETFQGIWSLLYKIGVRNTNVSAFSEFRRLNSLNIGNVYTFFRKFYHDFGVWGMYVMTFLCAAFFSYIYNKKIKYAKYDVKQLYKIVMYGYLYYIIVISSIDSILPNYISIGTLIMFFLFRVMHFFYFRMHIVWERSKSHIQCRE